MRFFKYIFIAIVVIGLQLNANEWVEDWDKEAITKPVLLQKGKSQHWCPVCAMSIKKFYKTSHAAKLEDGTQRQYCSMRCLLVDHKEHGVDMNSVQSIDNKTEKLIDSKGAFYVVDSDIPGTMSKVSKLSFSSKDDAKKFMDEYGGRIEGFEEALNMASLSLNNDLDMIMLKKNKKVYPMGKKVFTKMCNQDIDPSKYNQINHLKADIKNNKLCKELNPKQLQVVSLYLYEVVRAGKLKQSGDVIIVTKEEKCPVCGMYVYKYPRWAAQIFYTNPNKHFSFDGVKDLMKYYFTHKENIEKILVTDYYSQKTIDGTKAYYVIGSDVYGPMGKEFIPFANKSDAKTFMQDHKGEMVMQFLDINQDCKIF
ncbi:MAG: nitrous oxide reductase accessory protein NosL [Campylobacterales bacterium]|nr:nitrous oxide reductase accessory protein NosL [Campylobacterales bacterium]